MARYTNTVPQIIDKNGVPVVGAKKFFFEPNSTNFRTIYTDSGLIIPASNPQLSDAIGRYSDDIFLDGVYKEEQQDNSGTLTGYDGVTIWTKDPVGQVVQGQFEPWINSEIYFIPDIVLGSNDNYYISLVDNNQGNDPTISPVEWEVIQLGQGGDLNLSVIRDINGNESIVITPTTNAVNHLEVINAAATFKPQINQAGQDDVGVDIEGVELKNGIVTGDVFGDTNSNLTETDLINSKTLDGDINIVTTGIGRLLINGKEPSFVSILSVPELITNSGATNAWVTETYSTLVNAKAKIAILKIDLVTANGALNAFARETGSGLTNDNVTRIATSTLDSFGDGFYVGEFTVNLNASYQFDWYNTLAVNGNSLEIYLIGYHS